MKNTETMTKYIIPTYFIWKCMWVENHYAITGFVNRAFQIGWWQNIATTDAYAPSGGTSTCPWRWRSRPRRTKRTTRTEWWRKVGHGPTSADESYLPFRANVTRRHADSYAAPPTAVVVTAKKSVITKQSTRALTVSSGMSRRTRGGNGVPPQIVRSFLVLSARISTWSTRLLVPTLRARTLKNVSTVPRPSSIHMLNYVNQSCTLWLMLCRFKNLALTSTDSHILCCESSRCDNWASLWCESCFQHQEGLRR